MDQLPLECPPKAETPADVAVGTSKFVLKTVRSKPPNMQRARFWILCAIGTLVLIIGALLFGTRLWLTNPQALLSMLPIDVDMRLENLTIGESGNGDRTMSINADMAHYYKSQDVFVLERVKGHFTIGENNYTVEADTGRYDQAAQIVDLSGSVKLVNESHNGVLTCDAITLEIEANLVTGESPFCYSTPTLDLEGTSFVFNSKDKVLTATGRVHLLF